MLGNIHDYRLFSIMNCWHCNTELIWGGDFTFEDYGLEDDGIVSNLSCPNEECETYVEVYLKFKDEEDKEDKTTTSEKD